MQKSKYLRDISQLSDNGLPAFVQHAPWWIDQFYAIILLRVVRGRDDGANGCCREKGKKRERDMFSLVNSEKQLYYTFCKASPQSGEYANAKSNMRQVVSAFNAKECWLQKLFKIS